MKFLLFLWGLCFSLFISFSQTGLAVSDVSNEIGIQVVQSVPLETDLAQPGLPMTGDVWIEMIQGAKNSIDLAQFYLSSEPKSFTKSSDSVRSAGPIRNLEQVMSELEKAGKRGVKIRLLLSQALLNEDPKTLERFKKMKGLSFRIYDMSHLTGGVLHAKYWIVDEKDVFVGSQNFDWRSLTQIHELGVRVQDSNVGRQLTRIFDVDWKVAKTEALPSFDSEEWVTSSPLLRKIELVASPQSLNPPDTRAAIQALVELIHASRKFIRVQLLDYSPVSGAKVYWPDLDDALRAAALRGVKIQMLLSNGVTTQRAMEYLKSLVMISGVEIKTVTLPQYSGGAIPYARVIHSKYMIVDDEVFWIGTSNWGKGYFFNSRNIELILRQPSIAQTGTSIFQKLWSSSYAQRIDPLKRALPGGPLAGKVIGPET